MTYATINAQIVVLEIQSLANVTLLAHHVQILIISLQHKTGVISVMLAVELALDQMKMSV